MYSHSSVTVCCFGVNKHADRTLKGIWHTSAGQQAHGTVVLTSVGCVDQPPGWLPCHLVPGLAKLLTRNR
jgi:hypothetical protein